MNYDLLHELSVSIMSQHRNDRLWRLSDISFHFHRVTRVTPLVWLKGIYFKGDLGLYGMNEFMIMSRGKKVAKLFTKPICSCVQRYDNMTYVLWILIRTKTTPTVEKKSSSVMSFLYIRYQIIQCLSNFYSAKLFSVILFYSKNANDFRISSEESFLLE